MCMVIARQSLGESFGGGRMNKKKFIIKRDDMYQPPKGLMADCWVVEVLHPRQRLKTLAAVGLAKRRIFFIDGSCPSFQL